MSRYEEWRAIWRARQADRMAALHEVTRTYEALVKTFGDEERAAWDAAWARVDEARLASDVAYNEMIRAAGAR